jgi:EmrB/QacA subfamily drug resistance transporter
VAIGVLMATIDSSIVNVSLPVIARSFGVPLGGRVEWVVIAYLVVIAALLLTAGRFADVFSRRKTWGTGLVMFVAGSALCGAAPSLAALVAFRGMQGVGSAMIMAVSPAMLLAAFPGEQRGRVLGLNAVVVGLGISIGPTLGGVITQHFGWRWIFYVNVPLGLAGVIGAVRVLPRERGAARGRIDWMGAFLLAIGLGTLTGTLSFATELGWTSAPLLAGLAIAATSLAALVVRVQRVRDPLIDPTLFANRVFASASVSLLLAFMATFAVAFLMPFYLEQLRGWPAQQAGLFLTPLPLTIALVSPATGALADRIGTRKLAATGMLIVATGLAFLGRIGESTPVASLLLLLSLIGVGQATFQPPNNSALMGAAPRDRQGVAAGVLATGRVVGQSLSIAMAGALFAAFRGMPSGPRGVERAAIAAQDVPAFLSGLHAAFLGCAAMAFAASMTALVRGPETVAREAGGEPVRPR